MSAKNKALNKAVRGRERVATDGSQYPRTPLGRIPSAVAARVLSNPKQKLTGKQRRRFQRGLIVDVPRMPAKNSAVKLALKLEKLSLQTLYRRLVQSARRAATVKEILSDMVPGSQLSAPLEAEHINQLSIFKQVKAEIFSRK